MERIKELRKAHGLSLTQLADMAGIHRMGLARMERPDVDPKASSVAAIAKALKVPICELFEETSHERHRRRTKKKR